MEEEITLDELLITYEATSKRQERLMKVVAAALGATTDDEGDDDSETISVANINLDQGPQIVNQDEISGIKSKDSKVAYQSGDIKLGKTGAFGYQQVDSID